MPNYVAGVGSITPRLMVIGEAPGRQENEAGVPFVGPTGQLLNEYLSNAGMKRDECYITNVVKYQPPFNDIKKLHLIDVDLTASINDLWENEIRPLNPNCILCVGDTALQAVTGNTGILNYRGSILTAIDGKHKVVATIHPAALFNRSGGEGSDRTEGGLDFVYSKLIQSDISRAVEESNESAIRLPDRNLCIANNSLDLFRFFRLYSDSEAAAVDIESINCIPVCIGFAYNRNHAISVPLLKNIGKHNLTQMGDNEIRECWRLVDKELRRVKIIGHNFKYDEFKLRLAGFGGMSLYSDTLLKVRVIFPELPDKRLSTVSSLWTREPYYKDEGKEFKLGKSPIEQLFLYNAKDCAVEFEVDEETEKDLYSMSEGFNVPLVDYYHNFIMPRHKFYLTLENNGFRVDRKRQLELHKRYTDDQKTVHDRLVNLVGHEINVKSYPQIFDLLYKEMKLKRMKRNPTSEDTIVALLGNHCKTAEKKNILTDVLEERRIRDQKSRYINFQADFDGRCKTSFNIIATETCRSSTSVLKKPVRPAKQGLAFHTISKHGRLARDIRSMFIPDDGKVFLQCDSSQAEARVVAVLAEDYVLLEGFDTVDIHRRTAGLLFGYCSILNLSNSHIPVVDELSKDGPERFTGKLCRHAGNYDMGKRRLMIEFNTLAQKFDIPMNISEWRAGQLLELFHAASPRIKNNFHSQIRAAIDSSRVLIDPFGGIRVFNGRYDDELYKEAYANIPQRTVAHLVQGAALKIAAELNDNCECMWISENHDSLTLQVPAANWKPYGELMVKHMQTPIDFSLFCTLKRDYKLVIPADLELSDTNYGDFKKVKL